MDDHRDRPRRSARLPARTPVRAVRHVRLPVAGRRRQADRRAAAAQRRPRQRRYPAHRPREARGHDGQGDLRLRLPDIRAGVPSRAGGGRGHGRGNGFRRAHVLHARRRVRDAPAARRAEGRPARHRHLRNADQVPGRAARVRVPRRPLLPPEGHPRPHRDLARHAVHGRVHETQCEPHPVQGRRRKGHQGRARISRSRRSTRRRR